MARLSFSQIDAKDYSVVYFEDTQPFELLEKDEDLLDSAQEEYLSALADLQARIRAKYEPQFEDKRVSFPLRPDPDDLWYS